MRLISEVSISVYFAGLLVVNSGLLICTLLSMTYPILCLLISLSFHGVRLLKLHASLSTCASIWCNSLFMMKVIKPLAVDSISELTDYAHWLTVLELRALCVSTVFLQHWPLNGLTRVSRSRKFRQLLHVSTFSYNIRMDFENHD